MTITAMNRKVRRPPPRAALAVKVQVPMNAQTIVAQAAKWWLSLVDPPNINNRLKDPLAGTKTKEEKALAKAVFAYYDEVMSGERTGGRSAAPSSRR